MITHEQAIQAIQDAGKYLLQMKEGTMVSSAQLCLDCARSCLNQGKTDSAHGWALRSLSYSQGIFGVAYDRVRRERYHAT